MNKDWVLSQESFDKLLAWLDPDRETAGLKYEQIRHRLIKIFAGRGCIDAEDLADETINRVTSRLDDVGDDFKGDPARYFYGVAKMLLMEFLRRKPPPAPPLSAVDSGRVEIEYRCLEDCVSKLNDENRSLLLRYYQAEGREKIEQRRLLAEELGIAPNALRIRAYRIRAALQECVETCLERAIG